MPIKRVKIKFRKIMRGFHASAVAGMLFILLVQPALANETAKRIEQENRDALLNTESEAVTGQKRLLFDYGGWFNFRYIDFKDDDNDRQTPDDTDYIYFLDTRLWLKAVLKADPANPYSAEHSLYVRLKDLVIDRRPPDTAGGSDHDGVHLDYGYMVLNFFPCTVKAGRAYYSVGEGIAYGNVHDGGQFLLSWPNWDIKAMVAHTLPHEDNIDLSVPGYDKGTDRYFSALQCSYKGIPQQNLYGYVLLQRDYSDERPEDVLHDFTYNNEYFGLGARGKIKSVFSYRIELIKETGKSRVFATNAKKDISAWAGICGLDYEPAVFTRPAFTFAYAYGSGDPDRVSVTDTQNGNALGKDKNFLYFGYLPTGYALAPALSNLYFFQWGAALNPWERNSWLKDCRVGVNYYRYFKDKASGGILDPEASSSQKDIGYELDGYINWQVLSDLNMALQYGYFQPGKAYPDNTNDSEHYFSASATITF
jgi:hypothetical protein